MGYDLEQFCADCQEALTSSEHSGAVETIRGKLENLLRNPDFTAKYVETKATGRHTLYHDPDLDFRVYAHIPGKATIRPPHDHASSWAVYGQTHAHTVMTEWSADDENSAPVPVKTYRLNPGDAGAFDVGALHSIDFPDGARFVRVTGADLDKLPVRIFKDIDVRQEIKDRLGVEA